MGFNAISLSENDLIPKVALQTKAEPDNPLIRTLLTTVSKDQEATDKIVAKLWLKFADDDFVFNYTTKRWLCWSGTHWAIDDSNNHQKSLLAFAQYIKDEASSVPNLESQNLLRKIACRLENTRNWKGFFAAATVLSGKSDKEFNSDINLFNLKNGTYNLKTMLFADHSKNDYLTRCMNYEYNLKAECPLWSNFLNETFNGNINLIEFMQKAVGYTLTGSSAEQHFLFLYGTGANGKSVFINTLQMLFGEYSVKIPLSSLMQSKNTTESAREIPRLQNKRLAVANEVDEGGRLSESVVKDLTGGDTITGKRLYEATIEFRPSHTLWIYGNHKPVIKSTDEGIWRRPLLIPFTNTVQPEKRDLSLSSKLNQELSGIFNWALDGLKRWKSETLKPIPSDVVAAVSGYKSEMDLIGIFLSECTESNPGAKCSQKDLFAGFQQWQIENGDQSRITSNKLSMKLKERGYSASSGKGNITFWNDLKIVVK